MNGTVTNGCYENGSMNGHVTNGTNIKPKVLKGKKGLVDVIAAGKKVVWNQKIKNTQIELFKKKIETKYQIKLENYWDLHEWSVKNFEKFWEATWHHFGVIYSKPYDIVAKKGESFIDIDWFSGAKLNYAENILRFRDNHVAIIWTDEEGNEERVTYAQMYKEVQLYAAAFKKHGLQMGDRVACYISNRKEAVFAMLAATSMGAIWGGPLPFYGPKAASTIVKILSAKFLFTIDRMYYNETETFLTDNLPEITSVCSSLEKVIIVPTAREAPAKDISHIPNSCLLKDFLKAGYNEDGTVPELKFEQLPFNYPTFINFTSGTTGVPKGLIHSAGTFLPVLRDYGLHCDFTRDDVIFSMHPCGWNIWNLNVASFALGSTVLMYDGLPCFRSSTYMWDIAAKYKVSYIFFVTSIVDKMEKDNVVPAPDCNLDHLKMVTIGASPVKLQNIDYFLKKVKPDLFVGCLYGATEVIGIFSGSDFNTPVYSAEIQTAALGVDIKCLDPCGNPVVGQIGEIVVATPTPSFPIAIWNDSKQRSIQELYLHKYPGMWVQHDEGWIDPETKGIVIVGRSDEVIKQYGERFSSEVIYWAKPYKIFAEPKVEGCHLTSSTVGALLAGTAPHQTVTGMGVFPAGTAPHQITSDGDSQHAAHTIEEIADSLCAQQVGENAETRAVLFVKMKEDQTFSEELLQKIKEHILQELTVLHVPDVILPIEDIPYNLNGKKMERLVRTIISANVVPEVSNVKNPECLQSYCNIPELMNY